MSALPDLRLLPGRYAVCRLLAGSRVEPPPAVDGSDDLHVLASAPGERTLVCREDLVPAGAPAEVGFRTIGVVGPLDFALVGVLAGLTASLADAGISVFALSTYDTDYLLVREHELEEALTALASSGYGFAPGAPGAARAPVDRVEPPTG